MSSARDPAKQEPRRFDVLVLGASFAGVELLLQLQRALRRPLKIAVVDRQARHGYIPLVHERLCGRVSGQAQLDTRAFVNSLPGVEFVEDEVVGLEPTTKVVTLGSGARLRGRFVVVALGSVLAPPPEIPGGGHLARYKLEEEFDRTCARLDERLRDDGGKEPPHLVVVGGGISGVELAGELAHLRQHRPEGWRVPTVTLVSAGATLLPELAAGVGRKAAAALQRQGVELRLGARVAEAEADAVVLGQGGASERLPCTLALWAGGVRPASVLDGLGLPRSDDGWLKVGPTLQCFPTVVDADRSERPPEIFACGDAVRIFGGDGRWNTMQRAIECLWQAKVVARNLATLAACPPEYPKGVPPLRPHALRERFFYGVSLGAQSLVVYGGLRVNLPGVNVWFRRWLMRQYFARYAPRSE